ncbi:hypothetical protein GCM10027275_50310 [Rhabdobacter roseus]|uniref:Uncharacterized protein n=1 Tax=Rhabdobacter roseus TaxID=1655419 RepID=A0A840U0K8_9BACT|nr:DUF6712 family protein [Rhabdobacter roseus]MBB5287103.1 hypothetical protein [Rhabdobacter roseus]
MLLDSNQLKAQLGGVQGKLNFETVAPFVKSAAWDFRRAVGRELYAFLETYDGEDPQLTELQEAAQGCVAWAAFDRAAPHLKLRIGDLGIMKNSPSNTVAITKWEYVDLRESNMVMVDLYWEFFWERLDEARPEAWTTSEAYQRHHSYFIRSAAELTKYLPLAGRNRRFFDAITEYIRRAEQLYIEDVLTEGVFEELKGKWQSAQASLTPLETKLVERIREALAHLAIYEAYPYLPIKVDQQGFRQVRMQDGLQEEDPAERPNRQAQRRQLWQDGQLYLGRLRSFLNRHATESTFPSYYEQNLAPQPDDEDFDDFTHKPHVIL